MQLLNCLYIVLAMAYPAEGEQEQQNLELITERIGVQGIVLEESTKPVYRIALNGTVDGNGMGKGELVFDQTDSPKYDELGFIQELAASKEMKLPCTIKLVKTVTREFSTRVGGPDSNQYRKEREVWKLYALTGPDISSRLFLAVLAETQWPHGRLLVHDKTGRVKHVLSMRLPPQPEPCHPGCFPAGTLVRTPTGASLIEKIHEGDMVATIQHDGSIASSRVERVFVTRNRLVEVRTEKGALLTTAIQPLALVQGGLSPAGELKPGDRLWKMEGNERHEVKIVEVVKTNREEKVFNLVLGSPKTFIANTFLARSKPPADLTKP